MNEVAPEDIATQSCFAYLSSHHSRGLDKTSEGFNKRHSRKDCKREERPYEYSRERKDTCVFMKT